LGEEGNDILLGGAGDDRLDGHAGLDLLIGGLGEDQLNGGPSDDILVAGTTDLDADRVALGAIMVEWTRDDLGYDQRVEHLRVGGGHNGAVTLNESTVHDDGAADRLIGGSGRDLFFARWSGDLSDLVTDRFDEIVIELA
jgi:Ca2+-binding RTX toxin-like protein